MTHWAQTTDLGYQTLTRYEDSANNVNKFRRFIVLGHPMNTTEKVLITQTGRWTADRERGVWGTSTYRFIKEATFTWEKRASLYEFLERNVEKKKGDYSIQPRLDRTPMTHAEIRQAVVNIKDFPATYGAPHAHSTPTVQVAGPAVPAFTEPRVPRPGGNDLRTLAPWLIQAAGDKGWAQFDLLPEYAAVKARAEKTQAELDQIFSDLQTALSLIMLKES
jgi:hypothetical protein